MKRHVFWMAVPVTLLLMAAAGWVLADRDGYDDDEHDEKGFLSRWMMRDPMTSNSAQSKRYEEECGSCHFPFQPAFLPASSWQAIMQGLDDHFGDNAELSEQDTRQITAYLLANAAEQSRGEIPRKVIWSLRYTPAPLRITESAFFRHEHREIPPRLLQPGGEKLAFANCDSCHTRALQGSYNEHEIRIPGIGRWDD